MYQQFNEQLESTDRVQTSSILNFVSLGSRISWQNCFCWIAKFDKDILHHGRAIKTGSVSVQAVLILKFDRDLWKVDGEIGADFMRIVLELFQKSQRAYSIVKCKTSIVTICASRLSVLNKTYASKPTYTIYICVKKHTVQMFQRQDISNLEAFSHIATHSFEHQKANNSKTVCQSSLVSSTHSTSTSTSTDTAVPVLVPEPLPMIQLK